MSKELKPCPFCGSKAEIFAWQGKEYGVKCTKCQGTIRGEFKTAQEAQNAWDKRRRTKLFSNKQIKSCPFCGRKPLVTVMYDCGESNQYGVKCPKCPGGIQPFFHTRQEAIDAWNERV